MNNNSISVFTYTDKQIRTVVIDGEIWFVAKDVCDLLEIGNSRMALDRLPEIMKGVSSIDTLGGAQQMAIVSEAGLYKLAFTSRKPEAEGFTDFVAGTILPTIRKTGQYQAKPMSQLEILVAASQSLLDHDRRLNTIETKQTAMIDAITDLAQLDWAADMNRRINGLCATHGLNYQTFRSDMYITLEATARCDLAARKRNLQSRMKQSGAKYKDVRDINKLQVIADDPKLRAIFEGIVRTQQFKYAGQDGDPS